MSASARASARTDVAMLSLTPKEPLAESAQRALVTSSKHGFRFYELVAHHRLAAIVLDEAERQKHVNKAVNLARSLAASLPRAEAESFLARHWGGVAPRT